MKLNKVERDSAWAVYTNEYGPFMDFNYCDCSLCFARRVAELEDEKSIESSHFRDLLQILIKVIEAER